MWTAHLFQTTTGRIGPRLNFETMDWSMELNGTESINMRLRKSDLPKVDLKYWLSPWWAGVVVLWDNQPMVGGPLIVRPSESFDFVTLGCGGIRSVLAKRVVVSEQTGWWEGLAASDPASWSGLSLGTIAKRIVQKAQEKPGGVLPITYAVPDELGGHERNYQPFNVSNVFADDLLTNLSNVIDGPDIMFKPRLLREDTLTFDMWTGTNTQPRIYQKYSPVWDTTPTKGMVSDMNVIVTGTYSTSRVYSIGPGTDQGTLIRVATDQARIQQQYPMLETSISGTSSENPDVVLDHGLGNLAANNGPLLEVQMTVRGDGDVPFGTFWPGDLVEVVTKDWISLSDGVHQMRLLSLTGDHTNNVKISLQKEDKFA
jgi:hypothetical protein